MNNINIIGNLTRDAELKFAKGNGNAIVKFSIAVNEGYGDKKTTMYVDCIAFGKCAENIANYTQKGSRVAIAGKLSIESYKNKDGENRKSTQIIIREIEFLNKLNENKNKDNDFVLDESIFEEVPVEGDDIPF